MVFVFRLQYQRMTLLFLMVLGTRRLLRKDVNRSFLLPPRLCLTTFFHYLIFELSMMLPLSH